MEGYGRKWVGRVKWVLTVENTGDFAKEGTDPFGTFGDFNVKEFLHRK